MTFFRLFGKMQLPKWLTQRFSKDTDEGVGIRGAGASSQADFGEPITEEDLLFGLNVSRWLIATCSRLP
jgi:hypothetical protein